MYDFSLPKILLVFSPWHCSLSFDEGSKAVAYDARRLIQDLQAASELACARVILRCSVRCKLIFFVNSSVVKHRFIGVQL
jgi:hypothetical protein